MDVAEKRKAEEEARKAKEAERARKEAEEARKAALQESLYHAIVNDDLKKLEELLNEGANPEAPYSFEAYRGTNYQSVSLLL